MPSIKNPFPRERKTESVISRKGFEKEVELDPKDRAWLADPWNSLPAYGYVLDVAQQRFVRYDPFSLTHKLQAYVLRHMSNPPRDKYGMTRWCALIGPRQSGKSFVVEAAALPAAMYGGVNHTCSADTRNRADTLHKYAQTLYNRWQEDIRQPLKHSNATRILEFVNDVSMSVTAGNISGNIGASRPSFHVSEVPFHRNAAGLMNYVIPALEQVRDGKVIAEATPALSSEPSSDFWRTLYTNGLSNRSRWYSLFFPFWDNKNAFRPFDEKNDKLSQEELTLLNKYHSSGLRPENLIYRRVVLDTDPTLQKYPEMFNIWYPFDDFSCWGTVLGGIFNNNILRHANETAVVEWPDGTDYLEYAQPVEGAKYVVVVDPTGWSAKDEAAFHVFEIWADRWIQVAQGATHCTPDVHADKIAAVALKYNNAIVAVESNGVGAGTIALLKGRVKLMHSMKSWKTPGIPSSESSIMRWTGWITDKLMSGELIIYCKALLHQLGTYKNDKLIAPSDRALIVSRNHIDFDGTSVVGAARPKHHWDRVSALLLLAAAAEQVISGTRYKPDLIREAASRTVAVTKVIKEEEIMVNISKNRSVRTRTLVR